MNADYTGQYLRQQLTDSDLINSSIGMRDVASTSSRRNDVGGLWE